MSSRNHLSNGIFFAAYTFVSNDIKEQMFLRNFVTFYVINSHQIRLPFSDITRKISFLDNLWNLFFLEEQHQGVLFDTYNMFIRRLENFLEPIQVQKYLKNSLKTRFFSIWEQPKKQPKRSLRGVFQFSIGKYMRLKLCKSNHVSWGVSNTPWTRSRCPKVYLRLFSAAEATFSVKQHQKT